ncbi:MAG: hypothetical protein WCQ57_15600, partial [Verrucomicrobiota bacterium]
RPSDSELDRFYRRNVALPCKLWEKIYFPMVDTIFDRTESIATAPSFTFFYGAQLENGERTP